MVPPDEEVAPPSKHVDVALRDELVAMEAEDLRVRAQLAADGSLSEGYHPRMEAVHRRNAMRLLEIVEAHGWPGERLAGPDGAQAAWRIAQHAIGAPEFQRACLRWIRDAAEDGDVPPWQAAFLEDRVRVFEGRPQLYATQFQLSDDGWPVPFPVEDPDGVDERRRVVGLEPLADQLRRAHQVTPPDPATRERRDREYHEWLRRVGWRHP